MRLARCAVCTHTTLRDCRVRACRLCGGPLESREAPAGFPEAWRCGCYQCVGTPC